MCLIKSATTSLGTEIRDVNIQLMVTKSNVLYPRDIGVLENQALPCLEECGAILSEVYSERLSYENLYRMVTSRCYWHCLQQPCNRSMVLLSCWIPRSWPIHIFKPGYLAHSYI